MRFSPGLAIIVKKLKGGVRLRPQIDPHETGGSRVPERPLDLTKLISPDAKAIEVYPKQRRRELAALRRDAAISLLLEAPAECSERAPLPAWCGKCWTCRIDKFLRDLGLRQ